MTFESQSGMDHKRETEGEGLDLEEGVSPNTLPEGAVLVEKPGAFEFEKQSLSGALAEKLDLLSSDQYKAVVDEVFIPNHISTEIVEDVSDLELQGVWENIVAFVTAKNEDDKEASKNEILKFFGK